MGKTFKDRKTEGMTSSRNSKVKQLEEQHYTPKVFNDRYKRERISLKDIKDDDSEAD